MASERIDRVSELIERLIRQDEMYETFLNASPWGILVVDKTFHVVFMNKPLELMCGRSLNDTLGQHMSILMPKEDRAVHSEREKEYSRNPRTRTGNHGLKPMLLHRDGHVIPVEISLSPTKINGQTFYFASIRLLETLYNTIEGRERQP